jgi:hypothetical protein
MLRNAVLEPYTVQYGTPYGGIIRSTDDIQKDMGTPQIKCQNYQWYSGDPSGIGDIPVPFWKRLQAQRTV